MSSRALGEFEMIVIAAALRLGEGAYGTTIAREIETRTGRKTSVGALYTTLARLEGKGLVIARMGEATAERGGRAKRYVSVTQEGRAQLHKSLDALGALLSDTDLWPAAT